MDQRRRPLSARKILIRVIVLVFTGTMLIPVYVKYKSRNSIFEKIENVPAADFAIVLGAGITVNNEPNTYLRRRLDDAITLYKNKKVKKILVSGDNGTKNYDEISVMNNYLVKRGVPQEVIYGDYAGFDTYSTMARADKVFGIKHAVIVSQAYHLPRAIYIARQKGIQVNAYATDHSYGKKKNFPREYLATIKAYFDCLRNRTPKFLGPQVDTDQGSNINLDQLLP